MQKLFLGLMVLSLFLMYSCIEKAVKYSDSGSSVVLMVDQILKVELPGDASSGSDWRLMKYDNVILNRKGKGNYMLSNDNKSPGVYYFKFRAMIPGQTKLYMEYGNKYDSDKKASKIFELDIEVIPKKN